MLRSSSARCVGLSVFRRAPLSRAGVLPLRYPTEGDVRAGGGSYAEKERAQENFAVSQKDAELLKKLRESLHLKVPFSFHFRYSQLTNPCRKDKRSRNK